MSNPMTPTASPDDIHDSAQRVIARLCLPDDVLADALGVARQERDEARSVSETMAINATFQMQIADQWKARAERAEADAAALRAEANHNRVRAEGAELDLAREREVAATLRAAMPDPDTLSEIANSLQSLSANPYHCELRNAVYGWEGDICAALASAEGGAGTGGEG